MNQKIRHVSINFILFHYHKTRQGTVVLGVNTRLVVLTRMCWRFESRPFLLFFVGHTRQPLAKRKKFRETKTYRQDDMMWNVKTRGRRGEEEEPAGERGEKEKGLVKNGSFRRRFNG